MLAPQNHQPDIFDSMSGTVSSWYEEVDNCLKLSEVIPGNYEYTDAPSYGNVGQINEGSSTSFDIKSQLFKIISLDNSYITLEQEVPITIPAFPEASYIGARDFFVGYKMSAMAVKSYEFLTNTETLQSVNNVACHEFFLIYNSISDVAKENNECFATTKKIYDRNPNVPGTYIHLSGNSAEKVIKVPIKLKIPLTHFLLLFNLKYFPDWAGTLTLKIYTSFENIVVLPIFPQGLLTATTNATPPVPIFLPLINRDPSVNLGFFNLNEPTLNAISTDDGKLLGANPRIGAMIFKCVDQKTDKCRIHLASYPLTSEVAQELAAKYIQTPLLFPIQTLSSKDFTSPMPANQEIDTAMTISVRHCDSMFVVFRKPNNSKTCFVNPEINYSFNINGKYYPRGADYATVLDTNSVNMTLDALNINNSLITSINRDLATSLQPYYEVCEYDTAGVTAKNPKPKTYNHGDRSNFMIGIPFCDSDDFMGGITTDGTVQVQLRASHVEGSGMTAIPFGQPVALFLQDCFLKIRSVKPSSSKQIDISNFTIEQILTSNGVI